MTMSPGRCPVSVEGSVSRTLGAVVGDRRDARAETTPGPGRGPGLDERPIDVLASRFRQRVKVLDNGCWEWTGPVGPNGYGTVSVRIGRRVAGTQAHRLAYQLLAGDIPPDHELDHTCHVAGVCTAGPACPHRRCVNPDHLEPVISEENARRSAANRRLANGKLLRTHCQKGHPYAGENLRIYKGHRVCVTCNKERCAAWRAKAEGLSFFAQNANPTGEISNAGSQP